jgi:hypothetical protein
MVDETQAISDAPADRFAGASAKLLDSSKNPSIARDRLARPPGLGATDVRVFDDVTSMPRAACSSAMRSYVRRRFCKTGLAVGREGRPARSGCPLLQAPAYNLTMSRAGHCVRGAGTTILVLLANSRDLAWLSPRLLRS